MLVSVYLRCHVVARPRDPGCSYCYAWDTHHWTVERAEGEYHDNFEQRILVKAEAAGVLTHTLNPAKLAGQPLVIGTATDPYQPAERKFRLTRRVLEALLPCRGLSIEIIMKSPLVTRNIDVLQRLSARPRGVARRPIILGLTDGRQALAQLMRAAKEAGAHYVIGSALRLNPAARRHFLPFLDREFPSLAERYRGHYAERDDASRACRQALRTRLAELRQTLGIGGPEGFTT